MEQSVAEPPELDATESQYRDGLSLVGLLSRVSSNPVEVYQAMEDLRSLIERTVRRQIRALGKDLDAWFTVIEARFESIQAKIDSLDSQLKVIRWILGGMVILQIATIILVVDLLLTVRRTSPQPPPPPSATLQSPSQPEEAPPSGDVRVGEAREVAAPVGNADGSEPRAEQSVP